MKIHILEDNQLFIETLGELLQAEGITDFSLFTDHNSFMNALDESVDILVLDHGLNNKKAIELFPRIKARNKNCFIIILSGEDSGYVVMEYMNSGADRYIIKGVTGMREKFIQFVQQGMEEMNDFKIRKAAIKRNGRKDT